MPDDRPTPEPGYDQAEKDRQEAEKQAEREERARQLSNDE